MINVAGWSDLSKNVEDVGFVKCCKSKTLSAEVFERRADKIKFLAVDDQETVMECLKYVPISDLTR